MATATGDFWLTPADVNATFDAIMVGNSAWRYEIMVPNSAAYSALYKLAKQVNRGATTQFWDDAFTIAMKRVKAAERKRTKAFGTEYKAEWFDAYDKLRVD